MGFCCCFSFFLSVRRSSSSSSATQQHQPPATTTTTPSTLFMEVFSIVYGDAVQGFPSNRAATGSRGSCSANQRTPFKTPFAKVRSRQEGRGRPFELVAGTSTSSDSLCCDGTEDRSVAASRHLSFLGELEVTERTPCPTIRTRRSPIPAVGGVGVAHARNYRTPQRMRARFEAEIGFSVRTVKVGVFVCAK